MLPACQGAGRAVLSCKPQEEGSWGTACLPGVFIGFPTSSPLCPGQRMTRMDDKNGLSGFRLGVANRGQHREDGGVSAFPCGDDSSAELPACLPGCNEQPSHCPPLAFPAPAHGSANRALTNVSNFLALSISSPGSGHRVQKNCVVKRPPALETRSSVPSHSLSRQRSGDLRPPPNQVPWPQPGQVGPAGAQVPLVLRFARSTVSGHRVSREPD